ncbi:eukaryotic mitochondrial regulator protein-domain-containing protein [Chytriomyces sp. MP71]|nr:eukaryotic mitochondrial regulator protein-domain-containing protein [Chytriomyces sp. MP71]
MLSRSFPRKPFSTSAFARASESEAGSNLTGGPLSAEPSLQTAASLSDALRNEIFEVYTSNPDVESPLKRAQIYGISVARVEAILRLKALQRNMEKNNTPIQVHLTYNMEKLLKVDPSGKRRIYEPLRYNSSERLKPLFSFVGEQEAITPLDAATLLEKEPYANVQHKLDKQAERFFSIDGAAVEERKGTTVAIEQDATKGSKFNFSFTDISKVDKQPMFVRDTKGTLRRASRVEVYQKKTKKPAFFM